MPGMDGLELIGAVRKLRSTACPIVAIGSGAGVHKDRAGDASQG